MKDVLTKVTPRPLLIDSTYTARMKVEEEGGKKGGKEGRRELCGKTGDRKTTFCHWHTQN